MGRNGSALFRLGIAVSAAMRSFEAEFAAADVEHGAIFDAAGNEVWRTTGSSDTVNVSDAIDRGLLANNVFTHNHPRTEYPTAFQSFSDKDYLAASSQNVLAVRAVTSTHVFTLTRPAGGWPPREQIKAAIDRATARRVSAVKAEMLAKGIPMNRKTAMTYGLERVYHDRAGDVAREIGATYTRTPRRQ